jgi:putative DNA primase/helicase
VNYDLPPADLPNWLRELIPVADPNASAPFVPVEHALLDLAYEQIKNAAPGTGHDTVNRQGFIVGQHVGTGEIPRSAAEAVLTSAFAGRNEQESLKRVLRAGLEKGMANPKFAQNDVGNSQRLASIFKGKIRYCDALGWLVWTDDGRWEPDDSGEIMVCAKKTVANIDVEASQIKNDAAQKKLRVHAHNSGQISKLKAMVDLARSESDIPASIDELDADPYLLGVASGTVDLKTGLLHEAEPWELITKKTACAYDPEALCPKWESFIDWAFAGNKEVIRFIQKSVGYSMTGETSENYFFFCHGAGQNGKSTMLGTLNDLWGDYGEVADFASFTVKQNDGPRNDIAKLKGSRLVSASEITKGKHLDEALMKQVTGGDTVTARFFRREFFSFKPTFKIWFAANDKPEIGTGDSIWVRTLLIPFTQTVAREDRNLKLREELRAEGPGILAWAVKGCLLWQKEGLTPPAAVLAASQGYRDEMDLIGNFLNDREYCAIDSKADVGVTEAWDRFKVWCDATKERSGRRKEFVSAVVVHGHEKFENNKGFRLTGFKVIDSPRY